MFDKFFHQNLLFQFFKGTMVIKEIYSPFQIYILSMSKNSQRKGYFYFRGSYAEGYMYL